MLKGIWTQDNFHFREEFYNISDFTLNPKPLQRPHPEIFQGGNSAAAQANAGLVSDWYFMNGNSPEKLQAQIHNVSAQAAANGGRVRFGVNAFIIARETEQEARDELEQIILHADSEAVAAFGNAVEQASQSAPDGKGMWQDSGLGDLVQYNDGFRTNLIGTLEQIARRIVRLKSIGVDLVLGGFLHFQEEVRFFGERVRPLVRELERARQAA